MAKGKPRHIPEKKQNKLGGWCQMCDEVDGSFKCEIGRNANICKGNPHNCSKVKYRILASRSDIQKENGVQTKR